MKHKSIFFLLSLIFSSFCLSAQELPKEVVWQEIEGVNVPIPPQTHPRLYVRSSDLPALKERLKTPQAQQTLSLMKELSKDRTPAEEAAVTNRGFRYYYEMRGVTSRVQLQALDYLLEGDKRLARRAITAMLDTLQRASFGTRSDLSRASGAMLITGAMVYDWCYDQMKSAEKQAYIKEFIRLAKSMECGYPPRNNQPIAGHPSEWMIMRDMLSAGIAIYDEYPDMYNHVITMLYHDYIPARNYFYEGQNYHQGTNYVHVRFACDLFPLWILDKMGAGSIYSSSARFVLYDIIYRRRPDGVLMPAGDDYPQNRPALLTMPTPMFLASSYYKDEYLAYEFERNPRLDKSGNESMNHCLIYDLLWRDYTLKGKAPDHLPLTRYSGTPYGWMIARTGWDANCVIAEMKINEQFVGNHQHMDGGSFQIYHKGPLAIDAGAYSGSSGGYNSPNNKNYFKRTIAHNSLLVYDPDEKFGCWNYGGGGKTRFAANDGGQRMCGEGWKTCNSLDSLLSEEYTVGKVLAHGFGPDAQAPDYSYLKGDITQAYTRKVKEAKRSFVFLNLKSETVPAALIVYDKVSASNPDFRKYWLLHSIEEPTLEGNTFTVRRTKDGDSGMLHNTVLLPQADNLRIDKVGGPGKENWVFGTNYPNDAVAPYLDNANERGAWRVEVSPVAPAVTDNFLNVIQVADNRCNRLNAVQRIEDDRIVGVQLADRVVTFARSSEPLQKDFTLTVNGTGIYKFVITDLKAGNWQVKKDGRVFIPLTEVQASDGVLAFEGSAGSYEFCR